ncbi:ABC transporter ATP-binding protein [Ligilactobacillus cholophilus]|uniref:ABC transporter ATP-binding protein n=1 Tax=Ligilactobacillus cholophilus TaxID=3050131 RepID=UPI0025B1A1C3|nr:ABC transporter ATP-binding protein [Ligilactobacillus cholophilus]
MAFIEIQHLQKTYETENGLENQALKDINFLVEKGEFIAIMGESGSGKSTLLNMMSGLDVPTNGEIIINGIHLENLEEDVATKFRRDHIGFIFQNFNLLDIFDSKDNILLPVVISGKNIKNYENKLQSLAKKVGIKKSLNRFPYELSGGQMQRVAIARSLILNPDLILADEPTGQLDSKTTIKIMHLLDDIHSEKKTILMVTHSPNTASYADKVLFIKDGIIFNQLSKGTDSSENFMKKIILSQSNL